MEFLLKIEFLEEGDAVNVDVTAIVNEHYGDTSRMFCIGKLLLN